MMRKSKAQAFTEYAILIALVTAALFGMKLFMTRSVQAKFRESADVFGGGDQYAPGLTVPVETATSLNTTNTTDGRDNIAFVVQKIKELRAKIETAEKKAEDFRKIAADLRETLGSIDAGGNTADEKASLEKQIAELEQDATDQDNAVTDLLGQIEDYKTKYPDYPIQDL